MVRPSPAADAFRVDGHAVKVSLDKVQRIGVRTEKVSAQPIVKAVRGVGTVEHD
jgi:membrane fusion protein, copper/silver efflux system